jgi:hypothetical protein
MGLLSRAGLRRAWPRMALLACLWATLTGHVFSGCKDLFKPATPEPPSGPPVKLDYSSPEATLRTMERGMAAKGQGSTAWLGAFADSTRPDDLIGYHQIFDPVVLDVFVAACGCEAPTDWRYSQEQVFFLDFLNVRPSDEYAASFDSIPSLPDPPPGDTEALLHRDYHVYASGLDGSTTVIAIGSADLTFTLKSSQWLLTRWVDHMDPTIGPNPNDERFTLGRRRLDSTR